MLMAYDDIGLSDAGLVVPRAADFRTEIRDRYEELTEIEVDWDNDLILGILTDIQAQVLGEVAELVQGVYDAFDINGASGVQLSNLARIRGLTRRRATKGQVTLTLGGDVGTVITAGKMAEGGGDDGRARWVLLEDGTIPSGGTVDVLAEAEEAGRYTATAAQIDTIVTPVPGWNTVTNAEVASPGRAAETDAELRIRMAQSLQAGASAGLGSLRTRLLELEFVEAVSILDNPDAEQQTVEGVVMPPHSFLVTLMPDTLTSDQEEEVLRLLYENTPASIRPAGTDVVGTVTGADGVEKDMSFDYGDDIAANITGTLTMASGYSAVNASAAMRVLVEEYEATLQIGEPLLALDLATFARQVEGVLGFTGTINGSADLIPDATDRVVAGTWSVS
jgi:hypothetical protein